MVSDERTPLDADSVRRTARSGLPDLRNLSTSVVGCDKDHERVLLGWPDDQHPVLPVQMSTADVVEHLAGESLARDVAASILQFADSSQSRCSMTTAEGSNWAIGSRRQVDFDRGCSRRRN